MIIASGKNSGKKLVNYIVRELEKNGVAEVAALSEMGVQKIHRAGQRVANEKGVKIQADPRQGEVYVGDGRHQLGLIIQFTITEGN